MSNYYILNKKAMKRLVIFGLMLASAFALTNCTEQIQLQEPDNDIVVDESTIEAENPVEEVSIPFEVYANPSAETKTVNAGNLTNWEVNDKICVYHAAKGNTTTFHKHSEFTIRDVNEGLFGGALRQELSASNDWYFLYPYSSSEDTPKNAVVTIGASKDENGDFIQRQDAPGDRSHIAGNPYPMYGSRKDVAKSANPRVKMRHLSALVALKIVNQGDGTRDNGDMPITVRTIELEATSDIVGEFTVNFAGDNVSFTSKNAGKIAKLELAESVTIEPGDDATFYLAVKPFDASGKDLTVRINGSARKVKMPSDANMSNFLSGQMKTLRVPVKLDHPKKSDAVNNANFTLTMPVAPSEIVVNGEKLDAYIMGNNALQTLTLKGSVPSLFNALDAGFYVSFWHDRPAAMTVSRINLWIDSSPFYSYGPLQDAIADQINGDHWLLNGATLWLVVPLVMSSFSDGVTRDTDMMHLTQFIDPQTITFNGILSNNCSEGEDILIMDESPIYKELGSTTIGNLLSERFKVNGQSPTFQGLKYIVSGKTSEPEAISTAKLIYDKLRDAFVERGTMTKSVKYGMTITVDMELVAIFDALISSPEDLMTKLQNMTVEVEISTCPYHSDKAQGYGSKASPIALDKIAGPKNPLVLWGIDVSN